MAALLLCYQYCCYGCDIDINTILTVCYSVPRNTSPRSIKQTALVQINLDKSRRISSIWSFNPIHTGGGAESGPPLFFFCITFEVFIVTTSNFVTFPNFYLSLLWEKICLGSMPQSCLGNHVLSVINFFF